MLLSVSSDVVVVFTLQFENMSVYDIICLEIYLDARINDLVYYQDSIENLM